MDTPHEIAEALHTWMDIELSSRGFEWTVNPKHFLPANVTCDFMGRTNFINGMARIIEAGIKKED